VKRYIIHLLPEAERRASLDELRERVAERIGWNRALDYPTTHVTLVYAIQDDEDAAEPIEVSALTAFLDRLDGSGPIGLWPSAPEIHGEHVLMPIADSTQLAVVRRAALDAIRRIVATPHGENAKRAQRVKEQSWPHLTLAQEVETSRARQAMSYLAEHVRWAALPMLATEIALLARDLAVREPYQIVHLVTL
jgi:2'-5' RNA ligase